MGLKIVGILLEEECFENVTVLQHSGKEMPEIFGCVCVGTFSGFLCSDFFHRDDQVIPEILRTTFKQVLYALNMPVECGSVYAGCFGDITHPDLVEGFTVAQIN
jgi:hypothetical protein